ncbi:MAG: glycosyltransferase family 39 protein [Candidatus Promineifilaceae bacterium]
MSKSISPITKPLLAVTALVLLGFVLRLVQLNTPIWGDEVATWAFARRAPFSQMIHFALQDPTPPLYYTLIHFSIPFLGTSFIGLRWPSLLFGLLIIPTTYWSMRQAHFSVKDSLYATLLVTISSMLIYYAQEARVYALLAFLGLVSIGLLWQCLQKPTLLNSLLLSGSMVFLAYTHRSALFLVVAQIAFLFLNRLWRPFLITAFTFSLIGFSILLQIANGTFPFGQAGDPTNWEAIRSLISSLTTGSVGMQHIGKLPDSLGLAFPNPIINQLLPIIGLATLIIILGVGAIRLFKQRTPTVRRQYLIMLSFCILVPTTLALLAGTSLSPRPQWLLRGLIYIWPLYFMGVIAATSQSKLQPYLVLILVLLNGFSLYPYYSNYTRFDNATAFEQLNSQTDENDLIVADPWYMFEVINYYYQGQAKMVGVHQDQGWIDVAEMAITTEPGLLPLHQSPATNGKIYVYHRSADLAWVDQFPDNDIFIFNGRTNSWQSYERSP